MAAPPTAATVSSSVAAAAAAPAPPPPPSSTIYVGDLHPDVMDGHLFEAFKGFDSLASVRVCRDSSTGRSLCYGYVNFVSSQDGNQKHYNNRNASFWFCFVLLWLHWFELVQCGVVSDFWHCFAVKEIFKNFFFSFSFFVFCALFGCLEIVGKDLLDLTCLEKRTKMSLNWDFNSTMLGFWVVIICLVSKKNVGKEEFGYN